MSLALFIIIISTVILYFVSQEDKIKCDTVEKECLEDEYSLLNENFIRKGVIITVINMIAQELFIFAAKNEKKYSYLNENLSLFKLIFF